MHIITTFLAAMLALHSLARHGCVCETNLCPHHDYISGHHVGLRFCCNKWVCVKTLYTLIMTSFPDAKLVLHFLARHPGDFPPTSSKISSQSAPKSMQNFGGPFDVRNVLTTCIICLTCHEMPRSFSGLLENLLETSRFGKRNMKFIQIPQFILHLSEL